MYFGPAWDFDLALDNDWRLYPIRKKNGFLIMGVLQAHLGNSSLN